MNVFKAIAVGASIVADSYMNPRRYERPNNEYLKDRARLRGDASAIGADMRKAINKYGQSHPAKSR